MFKIDIKKLNIKIHDENNMLWKIPNDVTCLTQKYVQENMPAGTTSVDIPEGVTSIEWKAFYGYKDLIAVNIPASTETIGLSAFSGCVNLRIVKLSYGVINIHSNAFDNNKSLELIDLPDSLKFIGSNAFIGCGLRWLIIPNSVESLGDTALRSCKKLSLVYISSSVDQLKSHTFMESNNLRCAIISDKTKRHHEVFNNPNVIVIHPDEVSKIARQNGNLNTTQDAITYYILSQIPDLAQLEFPAHMLVTDPRSLANFANEQSHLGLSLIEHAPIYNWMYNDQLDLKPLSSLTLPNALKMIQIHHNKYPDNDRTERLLRCLMTDYFINRNAHGSVQDMIPESISRTSGEIFNFISVDEWVKLRQTSPNINMVTNPLTLFETPQTNERDNSIETQGAAVEEGTLRNNIM